MALPEHTPPPKLVVMRKVMNGGTFEGEEEVSYLGKLKPKFRPFYRLLKEDPVSFMRNMDSQEKEWASTRAKILAAKAPVVVQAASEAASGKLESSGGSVAVLEAEEGVAEGGDSGTIRALDQIDTFIEQWENEHGKEEHGGGG